MNVALSLRDRKAGREEIVVVTIGVIDTSSLKPRSTVLSRSDRANFVLGHTSRL